MKKLVLIRHAKTEVINDDISDIERQLKKRGENDARQMANYLKQKGYFPQTIICSNATRALQTAQTMASAIGFNNESIRQESFIYDGYTTGEFIDFISMLDDNTGEAWVIGHNPDIALIAMRLTHQNYSHFPTCATVIINFECKSWNEVSVINGKEELFVIPDRIS
jgi:phosphohistidine phosphatase